METVIGQIYPFTFDFTPKGFLPCDGQLLPITRNSALFSLLGTKYGGDGINTFALPDLRGRTLIGQGQGTGLSNYELGQRAGFEQVTLTDSQLPAHSHAANLRASEGLADNTDPSGKSLCTTEIYSSWAPDINLAAGSVSVGSTGGNFPHDNMQPYIAINYCIAVEGIYPSRSY